MVKLLALIASLLILGVSGYFILTRTASAPQTDNLPTVKNIKIGIVSFKTSKQHENLIAAMKEELTKRGYNPEYLQDDLKDNNDMPRIIQGYLDNKVDVIIANTTPGVQAAMKLTTTTPIVFGSIGDPVLNGLVKSLDSSENNVTGVTSMSVDITPTRLALLKQLKPNIKKVYFIHQPGDTASDNSRTKTLKEAASLGITLVEKGATNAAEMKKIGATLKSSEADAIMMSSATVVWNEISSYIEAQSREKIPLIGVERSHSEKGTVMSYGANYSINGVQTAGIVDQVLKGVQPKDIPIQRPEKLELIINRKVLTNIGLTVTGEFASDVSEYIN